MTFTTLRDEASVSPKTTFAVSQPFPPKTTTKTRLSRSPGARRQHVQEFEEADAKGDGFSVKMLMRREGAGGASIRY